jgi:outer membrane protein
MKITTSIASLCTPLALLACSGAAMAQDNEVRVGAYLIFYHVGADDITGPFVPPGVTTDVKNTQTVYLAYLRHLSTHFDLELALGVPPKTDTEGKGPATLGSVPYNGVTLGSVKWFSPTLLLEYKFCDESAPLRPFVGAGIQFTHFYAANVNPAGQAAFGGPTYIRLQNSIGPAATLGLTYRVLHRWSLTASFSAAQVESRLTAYTGGVVRQSKVNFNPQTIVLSVGYAF